MDCSQSRLIGCLRFRVADDVAENQFPFAPGVAGVDESGHVVAFDEFFEDAQAASLLSIGSRSKCGGMTGRFLKVHLPFAASTPSGGTMVSKWPTADEMTNSSFSK